MTKEVAAIDAEHQIIEVNGVRIQLIIKAVEPVAVPDTDHPVIEANGILYKLVETETGGQTVVALPRAERPAWTNGRVDRYMFWLNEYSALADQSLANPEGLSEARKEFMREHEEILRERKEVTPSVILVTREVGHDNMQSLVNTQFMVCPPEDRRHDQNRKSAMQGVYEKLYDIDELIKVATSGIPSFRERPKFEAFWPS